MLENSDITVLEPKPISKRSKVPNLLKNVEKQSINDSELIEERKKCMHEICVPPDWDKPEDEVFNQASTKAPAKTYSFPLDPFQKVSIACLERNESVLVSAHTSAGKTVVAQYAIAMALRDNQRVVYTSPIKALSNQKYRDLQEEFVDVGLITGDTTINPDASCLVMTTEILRSMLYRGSEVLREIGWVIFDEIHYMRDKERGVVWEETIILLPDTIKYVFLSATIPNAKEFAMWIAGLHNQPCHVVYTDFRPVPLQHYIFPAGGDGLYLVVDERGNFKEESFQKALSGLAPRESNIAHKKKRTGRSDAYKIVRVIMERNYEPVIVFSFSKRSCENLATIQMEQLDFNSKEEADKVEEIFNNAIDTLSEEDKKLRQVLNLLPLLKRGIGIHHSGLLPLLKEVIEILFQLSLIKCLFATETFSIGLNMPAKTVVFTSVRKFDGADFRWVTSGEYIQMSGRAGRRGLDDRGIVILMVDERMEPTVAKDMVKGQADKLNSSFHIGYNMLLNTIRVEGMDPERILRNSFHQFQNDRVIPDMKEKLEGLENDFASMNIENEEQMDQLYNLQSQLATLKKTIQKEVTNPLNILTFLQTGRLVHVVDGDKDYGWGMIVNFQKRSIDTQKSQTPNVQLSNVTYIVDVLLPCKLTKDKVPLPADFKDTNPDICVVPMLVSVLQEISILKMPAPKDLKQLDNRITAYKTLQEIKNRFPDGIPVLDPVEDMKIVDENVVKAIKKIKVIESKLKDNELLKNMKNSNMSEVYDEYKKKASLKDQIRDLKSKINNYDNVILIDELKAMKRVLRRLGYISNDDIISVKGRVACEINAGNELVLAELIFTGFFKDLTVEQIAAILSCFVFQEKSESTQKLSDELSKPFRTLQDVARRVAEMEKECKMNVDPDQYVGQFQTSLLEVTYAWAKGAPFSQICEMTEVFEGSIVRTIRRLEELMRQLASASKSIGNTELENKFADAINAVKRDIIFAPSLYL